MEGNIQHVREAGFKEVTNLAKAGGKGAEGGGGRGC